MFSSKSLVVALFTYLVPMQVLSFQTSFCQQIIRLPSMPSNGICEKHLFNRLSPVAQKWNDIKPRTMPKPFMSSDDDTEIEMVASSSFPTPLDKPLLAGIDFLALLTFAGIGKASHSPDGSLEISAVLQTAFPFLLAWFGTSALTGD